MGKWPLNIIGTTKMDGGIGKSRTLQQTANTGAGLGPVKMTHVPAKSDTLGSTLIRSTRMGMESRTLASNQDKAS